MSLFDFTLKPLNKAHSATSQRTNDGVRLRKEQDVLLGEPREHCAL